MKKRQSSIWRLAALAALVVSLLGPSIVSAQDSSKGLRMEAEAAYEGYFKYGEWVPVWVELENSGSDLEAELRVQVKGGEGITTFARPVSLPSTSRKQIPVYVLPNNFSRELDVQLTSGDQLITSQKVQVRPQPNISYFIGIVAARSGPLPLLKGVELPGQDRPKVVVEMPLSEIPERLEGMRSFDTLILNDVDTSTLTPQQTIALENWVRQGGRLVVGGGAGAGRTTAGLPEALQLIEPQGDENLESLPALADFAGAEEIRVPGPFLSATGEVREARILATHEEIPLVLERALGSGVVNFISLDLSESPFDAWSGTLPFWGKLLSPGGAYPEWLPADMSIRQQQASSMPYALSNLPVLDLPSARGLTLLLTLYILLVGPANYLVLRWQKRLHWAWVTIPLITGIFSAGAFGVGYLMRGTDVIVNKIAIVNLLPGGDANVTSYIGLFSPGQQAYEVEVSGDGLPSPVLTYNDPWAAGPGTGGPNNEMVFVQGDPGRVRGLTVSQFSLQSFMTEDVWPEVGQITGDLRLENEALVGAVHNDTPYVLKDATVILGKSFARIGDIAPGGEAEVNMPLTDLLNLTFGPPLSYRIFEKQLSTSGPTGPPRDVELKRMIVESIFERGPWMVKSSGPGSGGSATQFQNLMLLGWMSEAPPQVKVSGRAPAEQTTAMLYTPLAYRLPDSGQISLPPGLIPGSLVQMPREGGMCGETGTTAVYIGNGEAVFEFQIPQEVKDHPVEQLILNIRSDGGWWRSPEPAFYQWESSSWTTLEEVEPGINEIADASGLIGEGGLVRLRLTGSNSQGCFYVGLGAAFAPDSGPRSQGGQP